MSLSSDLPPALQHTVLELLEAHPAGISELELLKALGERGIVPFADLDFHDPVVLFRAHFLLFHVLYRLDTQLVHERGLGVAISPLNIALRSIPGGDGQAVDGHDPLRDYYADLNNLHETGGADVQRMLDDFWSGRVRQGKREQALSVLGLEDPVDDATIRRTYRRLAMEHHPDRGGEHERLQVINEAARILLGRRRSG